MSGAQTMMRQLVDSFRRDWPAMLLLAAMLAPLVFIAAAGTP
jgi:hypothetical protein